MSRKKIRNADSTKDVKSENLPVPVYDYTSILSGENFKKLLLIPEQYGDHFLFTLCRGLEEFQEYDKNGIFMSFKDPTEPFKGLLCIFERLSGVVPPNMLSSTFLMISSSGYPLNVGYILFEIARYLGAFVRALNLQMSILAEENPYTLEGLLQRSEGLCHDCQESLNEEDGDFTLLLPCLHFACWNCHLTRLDESLKKRKKHKYCCFRCNADVRTVMRPEEYTKVFHGEFWKTHQYCMDAYDLASDCETHMGRNVFTKFTPGLLKYRGNRPSTPPQVRRSKNRNGQPHRDT